MFDRTMSNVVDLSPMARRFAEEYLIDFKAGPAALRAGYAEAGTGYQLLADPRVDALVRELRRKASERVNISVDNVLENYRLMQIVTAADFFEEKPVMIELPGGLPFPSGQTRMTLKPLSQWTDAMRYALKSIKHGMYGPEIVLHDKAVSNERIGKYLGMWVDKKEVTGPGGGPLKVITSEMDAKAAAEAWSAMIAGET